MWSVKCCLNAGFILIAVAAVLSQAFTVTSVAVPTSPCYALDNSSRLFDFLLFRVIGLELPLFTMGFMVSSTLFCCGGFIYKTRGEHQHGIDALPGMTLLTACLETVSGARQGNSRAEDLNTTFGSEVSWGRPPAPAGTQGTWTPSQRKYGSM